MAGHTVPVPKPATTHITLRCSPHVARVHMPPCSIQLPKLCQTYQTLVSPSLLSIQQHHLTSTSSHMCHSITFVSAVEQSTFCAAVGPCLYSLQHLDLNQHLEYCFCLSKPKWFSFNTSPIFSPFLGSPILQYTNLTKASKLL